MKKILFFLLLLPSFILGQNWVQIGQDIKGEAVGDNSRIVSLSADGLTLAIGGSDNDGNGENSGHVFKSLNSGATWEDITGNIPDIPINDIVKDSYGNLFVATDVGVVASFDQGESWNVLAVNLPSVPVTDLHIHQESEYLYAATYGRSSYKINIAENILGPDNQDLQYVVALFPNPAQDTVFISFAQKLKEIEVTIYDALGRKMNQTTLPVTSQNAILDVSSLPSGLYYLGFDIVGIRTIKKLIKK